MKYFAAFLSMKDEEKSTQYRPDHLEFLENLRNEGTVLMNGKFSDGSGGLVIYKGDSFESVKDIVESDPYIKTGARSYTLREWEMVSNHDF
ncbi:YciI family protein [Salinicoccus sesuvii]|uniref:YciI family protein n=1 Tax=Salinicoccus sesuvii TaxID=868281 RepID=A0ABV7N7P1_9STAP